MFLLLFAILIGTAVYISKRRKQLDEMHGMMVGMTMGTLAGMITATMYLIPTGNFLYGVMMGSIVGLLFGIPFGKYGGHLGIMEGVIAGPMGGMMGAMLGQMMRPFSVDIFMPFFSFIILIILLGLSYAVYCGASCCGSKTEKPAKVPNTFITWWLIASIVVLGVSVMLSFNIEDSAPKNTHELTLPANLQQFTREVRAETIVQNGVQEIDLLITRAAYSPNVIVAKKGVPLKINVRADETAGCGSDIIFPDFGIRKIVPAGANAVIEFTPDKEGTFKFHCSMDMARGKLIVQ